MTQKNHHKCASSKKTTKNEKSSHHARPHFSQAVMDIAKANLKKFQSETDEAFLIRASIDRKWCAL